MDRELHDYSPNHSYASHDSHGDGGHGSHERHDHFTGTNSSPGQGSDNWGKNSHGSHGDHGGHGHDNHGGGLHDAHATGRHSEEIKEIDTAFEIGVDEWGTTTNPREHQTEALKSRIFHGANRVEMTFFGAQKGNKEAATPETFGARERRDMRELAEINNIQTTTHATVNVQGLSGLNMQQGMFSDDQRKRSIEEIKKAIHFAAEATTGGAIVFHTGEAPRYMHGRKWNGDKDVEFEMYPEEDIRKVTYLADPLSKRLVAQISGVDKIAMPIFKTDGKGNIEYLKDEKGNEVFDEQLKRVDRLHQGRVPLYETDSNGDIKTQMITFQEFERKKLEEYKKKHPEWNHTKVEEEVAKDFFHQQKFVDVMYSLNFGIRSEREYNELIEQRQKIMDSLRFYKELQEKVPKEEWWKFKKQGYQRNLFTPPDEEDPVEYLAKNLKENERAIAYTKELALHGRRTALEQLDQVERSKLADQFAIGQSAQSMGDLGVYTWEMNERAKKKQGISNFNLKNDLYLAPENLFPEMYGAHPEELKTLVLKGREEMAKQLQSRYHMNKEKANELAKKHIKATFDIGHINVWRKYFKSKEGESLEERDKRFDGWVLKKTKELLDQGIIGHIHVSDNFGFDDEHLTAGDGNAPIKQFIAQAKKMGFSEFIIESGSFNPMTSMPDTWMHFDSPVYGLHVPGFTKDKWTDPSISGRGFNSIYRSYFGRTEGPRYLVGDMSPSEDFKGAPFYTGMPME